MVSELLKRHPKPVLACDPAGPKWQRGSVFNPAVLRIGDSWRMLVRGTPTEDFGVAGAYSSSLGVAESNNGTDWTLRDEPLIVPTLSEEEGLGCEDPRATVVFGSDVGSAVVRVFYNAAELRDGWAEPKVRIMSATVTNDFNSVEKHGVFLATESPDEVRMKAAALFPEPLANGNWPVVFTFASESPYGTLMYVDHLDLDGISKGVTSGEIANMFVNTREKNVLLRPPAPVERGPEVGAPPVKVGDDYVLFYCPANASATKAWGTGALLIDGESRKAIGQITDLLIPTGSGEKTGVVGNVAFPSGAVVTGDEVKVFYGGGDKDIFLASGSISQIVNELRKSPLPKQSWPY